MGRRAPRGAEELSSYLRRGDDVLLRSRRRVSVLSLAAMGSLSVVALYQLGVIKHVPEPRLRFFNADAVDASGEAYAALTMPDAVLGIASYALTLGLAARGSRNRTIDEPWLPVLLAAKVIADAAMAAVLTVEQASKHRAFCSWCLVAAAATVAMVPQVIPEARVALTSRRRR